LITQNNDEKGIIPNFADVMKQYEGKIAGILGTLIVHLLGGILFMSLKLSSLYHEKSSEFLVEFQPDRTFLEEDVVELPKTLEELFESDDRFRDIVRNIANEEVADIDPMEYQDRVKEELIAAGKLDKENFIDEQKNQPEGIDPGDTAIENVTEEPDSAENKLTSNEMAALYQGPTRVSYFLENRHHLELPLPIYKCENAGTVVVSIIVERNGRISSWSINEAESSTSDPCLIEAATGTLERTIFNPDRNAPKKQSGSITYIFVKQ
jgi:hypothetical protein